MEDRYPVTRPGAIRMEELPRWRRQPGHKPPLAVIAGPTAVGKTALAIQVAKQLNGEIISADSMMIYRGMDIGTAKPTPADRQGVPHHLIDVAEPGQRFTVAEYQVLAEAAIVDILSRERLPMLVGGTGLYIRAVVDGFLFPDEGADLSLRQHLAELAEREGPARLHARLAAVDPASAARLHPNDVRRVIRALEVYHTTGKPLSEHLAAGRAAEPRYHLAMVALTLPRPILYARINQRVWEQIESGLVDETRALLARGWHPETVAGQALAYKELLPYLRGEDSLEACVQRLQRDTRHYAKRQFTWFKRDPRFVWFDLSQFPSLEQAAQAVATHIRQTLLGAAG